MESAWSAVEIILKEKEKTKVIDSPKIINNKNIENIKIKINNALALANKSVLMRLKKDWNLIDDYLYDDNYSVVAGLLKDSVPVVASEKYIIVANNLDAVANRINDNANLIENLLFKIFGYNTYVVGMSSEEWNTEKDKYILNIKNGVKYMEKDIINDQNIKKQKTSVDDLIDLMGESIIEYK